jgi:hypothetical protein
MLNREISCDRGLGVQAYAQASMQAAAGGSQSVACGWSHAHMQPHARSREPQLCPVRDVRSDYVVPVDSP